MIRLSKAMSQLGLCSRREADKFIKKGLVYVDGKIVNQLGTKVNIQQHISLHQDAMKEQKQLTSIILNKPLGVVSGQPENGYIPAISLINSNSLYQPHLNKMQMNTKDKCSQNECKGVNLIGMAPVGRLDINSHGLLLFTQDGRLAKKIIGESSDIEKEYVVRVSGNVTSDVLSTLRTGLSLDNIMLKPVIVDIIAHKRPKTSKLIKNTSHHVYSEHVELRFILKQGRKRQIRRMCELVQLKVLDLQRIRIGSILLEDLPIGYWRYMRSNEFIL